MEDGYRKTEKILLSSRRWNQSSPERNRVWIEPEAADHVVCRRIKRVSVVYYLSRNGHLEHPHFMEVPLSCPDGLYLKDVFSRLNQLRGKGMPSMYSWSSKRSYKNGYVWHDLCEDDYIHPVHGLEYVLKGSEILDPPNHFHSAPNKSHETRNKSEDDSDSFSLNECKAYKSESARELHAKSVAADASTQTDDMMKRRCGNENEIVELEGSPPPVDSSPETLESLLKADKRLMMVTSGNTNEEMRISSGRLKTSSVLMQLITCGSFSFSDSLVISQQKAGMTRHHHAVGDVESHVEKDVKTLMEMELTCSSFERVSRLEDKEYFSGGVIETHRRKEFPSLKRSSSYNADRLSQSELEMPEKRDMGEEKNAKSIPRKPKASLINSTMKIETPNVVVSSTDSSRRYNHKAM